MQKKQNIRTVIPINEAITKGYLQLNIGGANDPKVFNEVIYQDGVHFGKCMAIGLTSKIDSLIFLKLKCGTILIPINDSVQTMLFTHDVEFPLYPKMGYWTRLYAMCSQIHDYPPTIETTFHIGEMANDSLLKLSKYLEMSFNQNMIGQHAVWFITDHVTLKDLKPYGADSLSFFKTTAILNSVFIKSGVKTEKGS